MHILETKPCVECGKKTVNYIHFKFGTFFACDDCLRVLRNTLNEFLGNKP